MPPVPEGGKPDVALAAWLTALHKLAEGGDERASVALVRAYREVPALWEGVAGLAANTERSWSEAFVGSGPDKAFSRELVRHDLGKVKAGLAQPGDGALEGLLIERIAVAWLAAQYADGLMAQNMAVPGISRQAAESLQARAEKAERRFLRAVEVLARVRRLRLPAVQLNVADKQINVAR